MTTVYMCPQCLGEAFQPGICQYDGTKLVEKDVVRTPQTLSEDLQKTLASIRTTTTGATVKEVA